MSAAALPLSQREAIVRRFNQRVTDALVHVQRLSLDVILRYGDELADLFCAYPDDLISPHPYDFFVGYQKPHAQAPIHAIQVLTEAGASGWALNDVRPYGDGIAWAMPPSASGALTAARPALRKTSRRALEPAS